MVSACAPNDGGQTVDKNIWHSKYFPIKLFTESVQSFLVSGNYNMKEAESKILPGVLSQKIENNHFVLEICWKDGKITTTHFPVSGFDVVNPATKKMLGHVSGEKAIEVLTTVSQSYNYGDFNWQSLFN